MTPNLKFDDWDQWVAYCDTLLNALREVKDEERRDNLIDVICHYLEIQD